ncbi:MAG TPA: hypothetical protein VK897_05290 [Anaerolineales bacterium]|nr:hypothetical protein [Anaerolineales bacterium]
MSISSFLALGQPCDEASQWTHKYLEEAGLHPVQTFDLHAARAGLHQYTCPNHGVDECDCQLIIMLVYGKLEDPVTLILHGYDEKTWLAIAESPGQKPDIELASEIKQVLEKALVFVIQTE